MRVNPSAFRLKPSGRFVAFEGINGCGKTTLLRSVAATLRARKQPVVETREPGGTPLGEELRKLLLEWSGEKKSERTELLLFAAGRAEHVDKIIRPALAKGSWVLCDRFMHSSVAFQGYGRGLDLSLVGQANEFATQGTVPDLVVLLDLPADTALRRVAARKNNGIDAFENEELAFHERIRQGFLACAETSQIPFLVLDGTLKPEDLQTQTIASLSCA